MTSDEKIEFLWLELKRIASYESVEKLRRSSMKDYGLEADEAIEYAYENVVQTAKNAIRVVHRPRRKDAKKNTGQAGAGVRSEDGMSAGSDSGVGR